MIYGKLADLKRYRGISVYLDTAIDYLDNMRPEDLFVGRNEVRGDVVYINCMEYETVPEEEGFFEAHRDYLDIHVLLEGQEKIGVSDISSMKQNACDPKTDFWGYEGETEVWLPMDESHFFIAFPSDAHMVKIRAAEPVAVKKIVVKVKVNNKPITD
ncbi:MAG: YhcH/YjgK/YiaL family protein [Lachnospiraceae bacterium]|nr:YhcH/YjgK/YiaL family protein [Lachnospiraceae bacterium]